MRLDVGLVINIKSKSVTKLIESARLRIVAGSDGIDICLAHKLKVLEDVLTGYVMACVFVMLVQVGSLELDRLSVYVKYTALDLETAESDLCPEILAVDVNDKVIELRIFGAPLVHVPYFLFGGDGTGEKLGLGIEHRPSPAVKQAPAHGNGNGREDLEFEMTCLEIVLKS